MSFDRWLHMNYKDFHQSPIQKFQNQKLFLTEENAYSKSKLSRFSFFQLQKIIARLNNDKIE